MADTDNDEKTLLIRKIYLKDLSFESPRTPSIFQMEQWAPKTNLNLRSAHTPLEDDLHEVVLTLTIEAKDQDETTTLFLVEMHQAGLFEINGYSTEEFGAIIGSFCPNILFPFARETIASTIQRGGFPEFILQPINFDSLYLQSMAEQQKQAAGEEKH